MCVGTTENRRGYQIPWFSLYFIRSQGSLWMIVVREQRQNQSGVDSPPYTHTYSHKHTHTESYCQDKGEHMPGLAHVAFLGEHL